MTARLSPPALHARLAGGGELALLDLREQGVFARGHLFTASNLPLSRLELEIAALVPRRGAPIILCDDDDGLAERGAARLAEFGYRDLAIVAGGMPALAAAGFPLYRGVYVPSKAFGEVVEHRCDTPRITAAELDALIAARTDLVILDSRPQPEYWRMTIPGAVNVPGAELVHRVRDAAPSPETLVVVNCAGRTRSIIGAQSLINAGVPNPVVALENGTMGWTLAGLELETGQRRTPPPLTDSGRAWSRAAARKVADRFGVTAVDRAQMARWQAEAERTLYLFDVRSPEEYTAGHLAGTRNAPGGQLVQATDSYVGTRGARILLVDDDGVRATMTASWLIQMGWREAFVLADTGETPVTGEDAPQVLGLEECHPKTIAAADLAALGSDVTVVDLATSRGYRAGHIPGAWFAIRSRFADSLAALPPSPLLVLTSPDGILARLAAAEAEVAAGRPVAVLDGGTAAWCARGLPIATGAERMADPQDDVYLLPYEHDDPAEAERAMRDYLSWETGLLDQIGADEFVPFPTR